MVWQHRIPRPRGAVRCGGRRICHGCYSWARANNRLAEYPVLHRRAADVAEDYADLRAQGLSDREIAARLELKLDSLHRALSRARTYEKAAA
jgi:hypothetical protein